MKKIFGLSVVLAVLAIVPATADDFGAVISGGGAEGLAGFRTDGGTLTYWIIAGGAGTPSGASIGGTDLNASFSGAGFAAGSVPFSGSPDGMTVSLGGSNASGTVQLTAEGGGGGGGGGNENDPIDTGDTSLCDPNVALCVGAGDRFAVTGTFENALESGDLIPVKLTVDTGYFFIQSGGPDNIEVFSKVLDACVINGLYWPFFGGLSDQGYTFRVRDTTNGLARDYGNDLGVLFQTTADTLQGLPCDQ